MPGRMPLILAPRVRRESLRAASKLAVFLHCCGDHRDEDAALQRRVAGRGILVADVPRRFGIPLESFLANPTGTMSVVLSTQIRLTPEEKQTVIEKLKIAYQKKQEQQAKSPQAVPKT